MAENEKNSSKVSAGVEQRAFPRVDAKIEVGFQSGDEFTLSYSRNISKGGIFIETAVLPDPNAHVELVLDLSPFLDGSSAENKFNLQGRVVRLFSLSDQGQTLHQVAIQFIDMPPQVQMKLDRLYQELEQKKS